MNFAFAAWAALSAIIVAAGLFMSQAALDMPAESRVELQAHRAELFVQLILHPVAAVLLVISGIGLLRMNRFAGKWTVTIYAVVIIAGTLVQIDRNPDGFEAALLFRMFYAAFSAGLVHTVFRRDFAPVPMAGS